MKTEQQVIDSLRKRKTRIAALWTALIATTAALTLAMRSYQHSMSVLHGMAKIRPAATITPQAFMQSMPEMLSQHAELSVTISITYTLGLLMAVFFGFFLAMLIIELMGRNTSRLLIRMWDQIQELKTNVEPRA